MKQLEMVFIGDSLIEYFDWQQRFAGHLVSNFGLAGETVEGLLYRSEKIAGNLNDPDWLFVMTGTNNLAMDDYAFIPSYARIIDAFAVRFPELQIVITSLLPVTLPWLAPTAVRRMNERLLGLAGEKGVRYLDLYPLFSRDDTSPVIHYFAEDGVHVSDAGYEVWASALEKLISA